MSDDPRGATGEVADGSDRSLPAPDVSARDWARTRTSDATEPPLPVDVAAAEAVQVEAAAAPAPAASYDGAPKGAVRVAGAPSRSALLLQGGSAVVVAALLLGAGSAGRPALLVAVVLLQVVLVRALLAVLGAPAAGGAALIAVAAAVVADALVLRDDGAVDRVAGVVGLSLVAALLHQLVRRGRSRVTESLADTLLAVVVVAAGACLLALAAVDGGPALLGVALAAGAAALLAGRLTDCLAPRPVLATGATRGWPGLVLAAAAGTVVAATAGRAWTAGAASAVDLSTTGWVLVGLAVAVTVVTADLAVDLGAAELRQGRRDARRRSALRPAAALLPYALLGPVVLLAGRLVLP